MTTKPSANEAATEAEPREIEAVPEGPPAEEAVAGSEETAAPRPGRRRRLLVTFWLLPVVLIAAIGYLVAAQPERVAAFLVGAPPDMATAGDIERLAGRLSKIEEEAAGAAQVDANAAAISAAVERIDSAAAELDALHGGLEALEKRLGVRLEALETRISALEQAEPAVDPALAAQMRGLETRLAGLERPPAGGGTEAGTPSAAPALAALEAALAALETRVDGLSDDARAAGLEAQAAADRAAADAGAAADKALAELTALRSAVDELERGVEPGATAKLAAVRLKFAVDAGVPFADELAALQAAGDPGFGPWTARAEQGLPTRALLIREFERLARARVIRPDGPTGTPWLDDAIGRLSDVVSVRRVSKDLPGSGPDAALGRAEAHIEEGGLAAAAAELSGGAPPAFEDWLAAVRDRLAADTELQAFADKAAR